MAVTLDEYLDARVWRSLLQAHAATAFQRFDVIATPAAGATRKVIGEQEIETADGTHHYRTVLSVFSALVNSMGCPAVVGPLADGGVPPPALQLIGPWWKEHGLLEIAGTLEREGVLHRPGTG
jgi:Asp-tRNA(Asn)/Glu-tRNA(Gln) amidotransferase A subunit family amidase